MRHLPSISPLSSVYLTFDRVFFFISSPGLMTSKKARNESDEEINPRPLGRVAQASRLPRPSEERTSACCRLCERIPKSLIALSRRRASCPPLPRRRSLRSQTALPRFGLSQSLPFRQ